MIEHSQSWSKKVCREKSAEPILQYLVAKDTGKGANSRRCQSQMETGHGTKEL